MTDLQHLTEPALIAALSPRQRIALTLWGEARGSTRALREGIASVLGNRVRANRPAWGLTLDAVCLAPRQFSCWNIGPDHNHQMVLEAGRTLLRAASKPGGIIQGPILRECFVWADALLAGTHADTVQRATHYYAPDAMIPPGRIPLWAFGLEPVATIDGTRFFAGVR